MFNNINFVIETFHITIVIRHIKRIKRPHFPITNCSKTMFENQGLNQQTKGTVLVVDGIQLYTFWKTDTSCYYLDKEVSFVC